MVDILIIVPDKLETISLDLYYVLIPKEWKGSFFVYLEHEVILLIAFCFSKKIKSSAFLEFFYMQEENKYEYKSTNSYWKNFCRAIFFFI